MNEDAAKKFAPEWNGRGDEESDYQIFWLTLLRDVFGVDKPERLFRFQVNVRINDQSKFIDALVPRTKVLIEQKSFGVDLDKRAKQSDGEYLTPFEQAQRYADALLPSERPRRIIVCNFAEFRIYDLVEMTSLEYLVGAKIYKPTVLKLENFRYDYTRLKFIVDPNAELLPEVKISRDAAELLRIIYDAFEKNYKRAGVEGYKNSLDKLCTRLVFCFYAAYAKLIDADKFFAAMNGLDTMQEIFDALKPIVNGGLFSEKIQLPPPSSYLGDALGNVRAANSPDKFNWRKISPPIFGAMFESILNVGERRAGGMHYTSPENIHKVIDPLFFDDLSAEFAEIKRMQRRNRADALQKFQDKIAALKFFDPACGSGNFLTETYMSLRRLENKILEELRALQVVFPEEPVKVSIENFYGLEINDFAVAVAQTALWIAENQMLQESAWIVRRELPELPLKHYPHIQQANALQIDWKKFAPNVDYIIGNPPFVGARLKSAEQARDIQRVFDERYSVGNLDYVACWYKKAADFIAGTNIRCAFVSTNSVCQGDSIGALWKNLFADGIHIDFAHRTFKWLSDSDNMAHVHCVIVGFSSAPNDKPKKIFDGERVTPAQNINAYLVDGEDIFVESRNTHIQDDVPQIRFGSMPNDGGNLIVKADELDDFLRREPSAEKFIRPFIGADEFIKGKQRYCLWFDGVELDEIKKLPLCRERVEAVKKYRSLSKRAATRNLAEMPMLFGENRQPTTNYILVPRVSSERRPYIPMGFMPPNVIASDATHVIPDARLYHFGVLTSSIHMAWVRTVAGRLETRYRYSKDVVYNNFPWPLVSGEVRAMIEESAQKILDERARYPTWTFAQLYDEETMPPRLRSAHRTNDYNVALAYGFEKFFDDEARVVAELMKLYRRLTS